MESVANMANNSVGKGDGHKRNSDHNDRPVSKKARPSDDYSKLSKAKVSRLQPVICAGNALVCIFSTRKATPTALHTF